MTGFSKLMRQGLLVLVLGGVGLLVDPPRAEADEESGFCDGQFCWPDGGCSNVRGEVGGVSAWEVCQSRHDRCRPICEDGLICDTHPQEEWQNTANCIRVTTYE